MLVFHESIEDLCLRLSKAPVGASTRGPSLRISLLPVGTRTFESVLVDVKACPFSNRTETWDRCQNALNTGHTHEPTVATPIGPRPQSSGHWTRKADQGPITVDLRRGRATIDGSGALLRPTRPQRPTSRPRWGSRSTPNKLRGYYPTGIKLSSEKLAAMPLNRMSSTAIATTPYIRNWS